MKFGTGIQGTGRADLLKLEAMLDKALEARLAGLPQAEREAREVLNGDAKRLVEWASLTALRLGTDPSRAQMIGGIARYHDIGKLEIPSYILLKPGKLSIDERRIMDQHTIHGVVFIENAFAATPLHERPSVALMAEATDVAGGHHERHDGSGYPHGTHGWRIPLSAKIAAVADVFDALITERPYKQAWSRMDAAAHIQAGAGTHFDPLVAEAFLAMLEQTGFLRSEASAMACAS